MPALAAISTRKYEFSKVYFAHSLQATSSLSMTDLHFPFSRAGIRSSADVADEPPLDDPLFKRIHELNQSVTFTSSAVQS